MISKGLLGLTLIIWTDFLSAHWILSSIIPSSFTSSIDSSVFSWAAWRLTCGQDESYYWYSRPRENFRGFSARWFLKNLGQFLSALAISGHSERFSPGVNGSEVGGPIYMNSPPGPPTSEHSWPGENLSEWPEIARALRNWPKFFKNHRAENPRKFSRGLT